MADSGPSPAQKSVPVAGNGTPPTQVEHLAAAGPLTKRKYDKIPREFGRYRLGDCLGKGGMGAVFKAYDSQLDRQVALKIPFLTDDDEETRARFYREARAAATLQHANICPVFDVGEFNDIPYLTMAFIEGRSLAKAIIEGQRFTPVQISHLVRKLALAMHEAHSRGVVHRDLKPANVLIKPNGEPVIMDFGLARREGDQKSQGLTRQGDILGTVDYMSPEQVEGNIDSVGPSADIYALGVILYEMLAGRRPFEGTTTSILAQIVTKEPARPSEYRPDVPEALEEICRKAMAKKVENRYASMAQFAAALADFLRSQLQTGGTIVARGDSATRPATTPTPTTPKPAPPPPETKPIASADTAVPAKSPPKSTPKSAPKSTRSGRKRKSKASSGAPLAVWLILGGLAVLSVGVIIALAVIFWPSSGQPVANATNTGVGPPYTPPSFYPNPSAPPVNTAPDQKSKPKPTPKIPFNLRAEPAEIALVVGESQKVQIKVDRQDYSGPLELSWTAPPELRVAPNGPVRLQPNQSDVVVTLRILSEPVNPELRLELTAKAEGGANAVARKAMLAVQARRGGPCIRVVETGIRAEISVLSMAFTPDASLVLIGGGRGKQDSGPGGPGPGGPGPGDPGPGGAPNDQNAIQVWNLEKGTSISSLAFHKDRVTGLSISADGKSLLSVGADRTIAMWDVVQGQRKRQSPEQPIPVLTAAMSPDAKRGVVIYSGAIPNVTKVNLDTFLTVGQPYLTQQLTGSKLPDAIRCAAVSSERKVIVGGLEGKLLLLDWTDKVKPKALTGHTDAVRCALFSPDGKMAATGSGGVLTAGTLQPGKDNIVQLWDITELSSKWSGEGHTQAVVCLAFSSDGKLLASGSEDGMIRVWHVDDGRSIATFAGHSGKVLAMVFDADGKTLWSGSADRTLRLWRMP